MKPISELFQHTQLDWLKPMQCAQTRKQFINEIYVDYRTLLTRFLKGWTGSEEEAEDLVQTTFMKVCKMDEPREIVDVRAFLFRAARNIAIDQYRANRSALKREFCYGAEREYEQNDITPEEIFFWRQLLQRYTRRHDDLSPKTQLIFEMSRMRFMSYKEISHSLGISVSMVQKYMTRAMSYYSKKYKEDISPDSRVPVPAEKNRSAITQIGSEIVV